VDKDTKSNFRIVKYARENGRTIHTYSGGNRFSTSIGGTLTGFHGHILIWDDPLNPQQAVSPVQIKTATDWLDQTFASRKVDKRRDVTIGIMQRLHENDPTGHLMKKKNKRIHHISLPGEIRNYREQVQPPSMIQHYKNDLLDPIRMPWSVLDDLLSDLGQYGYAGQIGQKPTPPGGGMFKVDQMHIIDRLPPEDEWEIVVRYWDKAGSDGKGAFTVGVKLIRHKGKFIVADIKRGQWSSEVRESIIRKTAEADGDKCFVYVEQEPGSGGKESAEGTIRRLAGFSVYADRPTGDKIYRADPFSVQVNNGNVWLIRADWNDEFKRELENFPYGTYKDQVDGASGAFAKVTSKKTVKVF
jgi:predicted phage terminase large subunit-like protein